MVSGPMLKCLCIALLPIVMTVAGCCSVSSQDLEMTRAQILSLPISDERRCQRLDRFEQLIGEYRDNERSCGDLKGGISYLITGTYSDATENINSPIQAGQCK